MAQRSRDYNQNNKNKHNETVQKYYKINKEKINQYIKAKREGNKSNLLFLNWNP